MGYRGNKNITFFQVIDRSDNNRILTITCTKQESIDYGLKFLRVKHYEHFKAWCDLREYDVNSEDAWKEYFVKVLTKEDKTPYAVIKRTYKLNNVAAILRMFGGVMPLGCKYETEAEYKYLQQRLMSQQIAAELIKEKMKEAEKEVENGKQ